MANAVTEVVRSLKKLLDDRDRRTADVHPARVVGRNADGTAQLLRLDGECISRGGTGGYEGEIVTTLPSLANRQGTAGIPLLSRRDVVTLLYVDHLDPRDLPVGATGLPVAVIGYGFTAATSFSFLLPASEEVNPSITIVSAVFVDSERVNLVVDVAADAELFDQAPIGYEDPVQGIFQRRKDDAYSVFAPEVPEVLTHEYTPLGFCYRPNMARIARRHVTKNSMGAEIAWALEFVNVSRSAMPHLDAGYGTMFFAIPLTAAQAALLRVFSMQNGPGGSFYLYYSIASNEVRLARIYYAGAIAKEISYTAPLDASAVESQTYATELYGPWLYSLELVEGGGSFTGPPFSCNNRLTRRHYVSLALQASWVVPNPAGGGDGWATNRTSGIYSFVNLGGMLRAYIFYIKQPTGGADTRIFYQDFDLGLTPFGGTVGFASNNTPTMGVGNNVARHPEGGIVFVAGTHLYRKAYAGGGLTTVLNPYNPDGGELMGIAQVNEGQTLVLGSGTTFTTSILSSSGQQVP